MKGLDVAMEGIEGMEGSRPRRERCEGVRGMSVMGSLDLRGRRAHMRL
jgi:hypothetical protein